ncbi:MAG: S41 family peptidase, partial [Deltaproteobacteria bacterium]|nr:S41 family peptidase [Deltaproteobacteria bacterium]
ASLHDLLESDEPVQISPYDGMENLKSPLTVEALDNDMVRLTINGQNTVVAVPKERQTAALSLLKGYEFVKSQSGGDPEKRMLYDSLSYMAYNLDPHSNFLPPEHYGNLKAETSGKFGGVGIEVGMRGDLLTIIAPIEGTPAAGAKLHPLDRIVAVDHTSTIGMRLLDAVELIRGEIGTSVVLTIRRAGTDDFDVTLVRDTIPVHTIKTELSEGGVAWIRVYSFNVNTAKDLREAIENYEVAGKTPKVIILDLRNNPGGLLDQAVNVADYFLTSGMIVNTIGRGRLQEQEKFASARGTRADVPLIVLINSGSASGSEIVAGALQDHKRALIVGTRSFGKGSVQSIFRLSGGSALRLTTALYYTPSGRSIQAEGIVPDLRIRLPEDDEKILALYSESALQGHLTSEAVVEQQSRFAVEAEKLRQHYLKTGETVDDEDYPEKGDWLLVFARHLAQSPDKSIDGMLGYAEKMVSRMAEPVQTESTEPTDEASDS